MLRDMKTLVKVMIKLFPEKRDIIEAMNRCIDSVECMMEIDRAGESVSLKIVEIANEARAPLLDLATSVLDWISMYDAPELTIATAVSIAYLDAVRGAVLFPLTIAPQLLGNTVYLLTQIAYSDAKPAIADTIRSRVNLNGLDIGRQILTVAYASEIILGYTLYRVLIDAVSVMTSVSIPKGIIPVDLAIAVKLYRRIDMVRELFRGLMISMGRFVKAISDVEKDERGSIYGG